MITSINWIEPIIIIKQLKGAQYELIMPIINLEIYIWLIAYMQII